jgi:hypothetical protein
MVSVECSEDVGDHNDNYFTGENPSKLATSGQGHSWEDDIKMDLRERNRM